MRWDELRALYREIQRCKRLDTAIQIAIGLFSGLAIALTAFGGDLQAWGYIIGLAAQPFWHIATWRARQWGMFAVACWYTAAWAVGVFKHFT